SAAHGDAELLCRLAAACSRPESSHDARAKIFRIGLRHPCRPPPASILNHSEASLGIPCDSLTVDSALGFALQREDLCALALDVKRLLRLAKFFETSIGHFKRIIEMT